MLNATPTAKTSRRSPRRDALTTLRQRVTQNVLEIPPRVLRSPEGRETLRAASMTVAMAGVPLFATLDKVAKMTIVMRCAMGFALAHGYTGWTF